MTQSLKAVAWIISPINVLQCLIAQQKMQNHLGMNIDLEILHYYPSTDIEITTEIFTVIQKLAHNINPSVECHFIRHDTNMSAVLKRSTIPSNVDLIFLAHDVVGNFFEILKDAYPNAKSVCYGDALGQFFQREVHLGYLQSENRLLRALKSKMQNILGIPDTRNPSLPKDYAVLTIPVSQAKLPKTTKLLIPEKHIALETVTQCAQNDGDLANYCQSLEREIAEHNGNACLFMTENMSEGNFIPLDKECDMYAEAIEKNCESGTLIYIKQHPGEQYDRMALLNQKLGNRFTLKKFNTNFKRYPIELFHAFLQKCVVIGMFYPALSLKYLYNMDVIQPMDNALIDRYFEERFRNSYKNAVSLNMIPLGRLQNWDGKGLLYDGR